VLRNASPSVPSRSRCQSCMQMTPRFTSSYSSSSPSALHSLLDCLLFLWCLVHPPYTISTFYSLFLDEVTGLIFTKLLHDVEALVPLLTLILQSVSSCQRKERRRSISTSAKYPKTKITIWTALGLPQNSSQSNILHTYIYQCYKFGEDRSSSWDSVEYADFFIL